MNFLNQLKLAFLVLCIGSFSMSFAAEQFGADKHMAKGVKCQVCHGVDKNNPDYPTEQTCIQCHDKKALGEKTKDLPGANPHQAPHNGDCTLCHLQHEKPENYCAQCHDFKFKIPG